MKIRTQSLATFPGYIFSAVYCTVGVALLVALISQCLHVSRDDINLSIQMLVMSEQNSGLVVGIAAALCLFLAIPISYRLRFCPPYTTLFSLLQILAPFFVSTLILYYGIAQALGSGLLQLVGGLIFKYLPLTVCFGVAAMQRLPAETPFLRRNLKISQTRYWTQMILPNIRTYIFLMFLFIYVTMSLDTVADGVLDNGNLQGLGDVINTWANSSDFHDISAFITSIFLLFIGAIVIVLVFGVEKHLNNKSDWHPTSGRLYHKGNSVLAFFFALAYSLGFVLICLTLVNSIDPFKSYDNLLVGTIRFSLQIAFGSAIASTVLAISIALSTHFSKANWIPGMLQIMRVGLIVPLLIPPILSAQAAASIQGEQFDLAGSPATLIFWETFFSAPIFILIVLAQPFVGDKSMFTVAENHGVGQSKYLSQLFFPQMTGVIVTSFVIVFSIVFGEPIISQYTSGFTKPLGAALLARQESGFEPYDYVVMGWNGLAFFSVFFFVSLFLFIGYRAVWLPDSLRDAATYQTEQDFP